MKRSQFLKSVLFAAALPKLLSDVKADAILTGTSNVIRRPLDKAVNDLMSSGGVEAIEPLIDILYTNDPQEALSIFRRLKEDIAKKKDIYQGLPHYQGINFKRFTDLSE